MTTTSSTSTSAAAATLAALNGTKSSSANQVSDTQDRFLKLLTAQLKNQDPLNPMDNAQMTSQMAQISTVDGIERLNATLKSMMSGSIDTQASQAAALVGQAVLVPGSSMSVTDGGSGVGGFDLAKNADSVAVAIKDSSGLVVRTITLNDVAAGTNTFAWDGKNDAGAAVAAGTYSYTIKALQGGNSVDATALAVGKVGSVDRSGTALSLSVLGLGSYALSDVRKIY